MVSLDTLRTWVGTDEDDDLLLGLEQRAVAHLALLTHRNLGEPGSIDAILNGPGSYALFLPDIPRVSPAPVISVRDLPGGDWQVIENTDYETDGRRLYRIGSVWPLGLRNIRAQFDAGYSGDAPADAQQAVLDLVSHLYRTRVSAVASASPGEESWQSRRLPDTVRSWVAANAIMVQSGGAA